MARAAGASTPTSINTTTALAMNRCIRISQAPRPHTDKECFEKDKLQGSGKQSELYKARELRNASPSCHPARSRGTLCRVMLHDFHLSVQIAASSAGPTAVAPADVDTRRYRNVRGTP